MWADALFISNLVNNGETMCMGWGWYLQVDFQLFIASVFLLQLYSYRKKVFLVLVGLLCVASTIFVFIFTINYNVKIYSDIAEFGDTTAWMLGVYIKPWGRCVPYFMGLVFGVLFMEFRSKY